MAKRIYWEDSEQRALIQWADLTPMPAGIAFYQGAKIGHYLFAIPNGGARNKIEASRLVGLGVRAGVSDLFFSFPSPGVPQQHGLYIEMKAAPPHDAPITANQCIFLQRALTAGYQAVVCKGWDAAREAIHLYLRADL